MFWLGRGLLVLLMSSVLHFLIAQLAVTSEVHVCSCPVIGCSDPFCAG
jgi:hypothetical protein